MDVRLTPQTSLKQQLNRDMLRSLEVLRMPLAELRSHVLDAIVENPMLELEVPVESLEELVEISVNVDAEKSLSDEVAYSDFWEAGSWGEDIPDRYATIQKTQSFTEMLKEQIGALHLQNDFRLLCLYVVDCLDRRGYLVETPEAIADGSGCNVDSVLQAVYLVQSLQPVGVAARDLRECLILQLAEGEGFTEATIRLVKDGLPLLARQDIEGIMSLLNCEKPEAIEACNIVRRLNPLPSRGYYTGENMGVILPDAEIQFRSGQLSVSLSSKLPRIEICKEYQGFMQECVDAEAKRYLQTNMAKAKGLATAVEMRNSTLSRILWYVVAKQSAFFMDGKSLLPMTMAEVASDLELHPSTIGRAVNEKYIVCAAGTIPLKSLFTAPLREGQATLSSPVVKAKIRQFILNEDKSHPLSDEALRCALEATGVRVSRRVIAKYREELKILSSTQRKRRI